jgi:hypothetical protein
VLRGLRLRSRSHERLSILQLFVALIGLGIAGFLINESGDAGHRSFILRASALASAAIFSAGFLVARPSELRNIRWASTIFACTHSFHLGAIVAHSLKSTTPAIDPLTLVVGGLAYVGILSSAFIAATGQTLLRCGWFVWAVFAATYAQRAMSRPFTSGLGLVVLLGIAATRIMGRPRNLVELQ